MTDSPMRSSTQSTASSILRLGGALTGTPPQVYSRSVTGFPFDISYLLMDEEVQIVASAHERRLPGYWERRSED